MENEKSWQELELYEEGMENQVEEIIQEQVEE